MPVTILINILSNYSDGRAKNRSQSVSISALLFTTNKRKKHKMLLQSIPSKRKLQKLLAVITTSFSLHY